MQVAPPQAQPQSPYFPADHSWPMDAVSSSGADNGRDDDAADDASQHPARLLASAAFQLGDAAQRERLLLDAAQRQHERAHRLRRLNAEQATLIALLQDNLGAAHQKAAADRAAAAAHTAALAALQRTAQRAKDDAARLENQQLAAAQDQLAELHAQVAQLRAQLAAFETERVRAVRASGAEIGSLAAQCQVPLMGTIRSFLNANKQTVYIRIEY